MTYDFSIRKEIEILLHEYGIEKKSEKDIDRMLDDVLSDPLLLAAISLSINEVLHPKAPNEKIEEDIRHQIVISEDDIWREIQKRSY